MISTTEPVAGAERFMLSTTGSLWIGTERFWDPRGTTGSLDVSGANKGVDEMPAVFLQLALP